METVFIDSKNSGKSNPHRLLLNLTDKINLKGSDKYDVLSNFSIYYAWKKIKMSYKYNIFKISALTWNEEFELPDGSYSLSDIQDYLGYILKKHGEETDNLSIKIYVNKIDSRIMFKIKIGYYFEFLTPETMKSIESTKIKITKDKNGENMLHLEITDAVLLDCNTVNNSYQKDSKIFHPKILKVKILNR